MERDSREPAWQLLHFSANININFVGFLFFRASGWRYNLYRTWCLERGFASRLKGASPAASSMASCKTLVQTQGSRETGREAVKPLLAGQFAEAGKQVYLGITRLPLWCFCRQSPT